MSSLPSLHKQQGAVLIVGMIMLVLFTLMVTSAFTLSSTNALAVSNMQIRTEALAAANSAIEKTIGSWNLTSNMVANDINIDIDSDGTTDYVVMIAAPVCKHTSVSTSSISPGETPPDTLMTGFTIAPIQSLTPFFDTTWDVQATVQSASTGAKMIVHQGMAKTLSSTQCASTTCAPCS